MRRQTLLRIALVTVLTPIVLAGLYLLAAYGLSKIRVEREASTATDVTIYILTNGVHTDLVLPVRNAQMDWSQAFAFKNTTANDTTAAFVALGWGDKGFYLETPTWADLTFRTAFKAAFRLSTSAVHATFYPTMTEGATCKKIAISRAQYARLIQYVKSSLATDADGQPVYIKTTANYGANDAFYEANGKYSLFHTCNTWANNGLKSCGQKACWWTPFDTGIFNQYAGQ